MVRRSKMCPIELMKFIIVVGSDVPEYQLPYQNYLDIRQNSLEQMQLCVCRKKVRPLLPTAVTNISVRILSYQLTFSPHFRVSD